jgi:hypothetical protein
MIAPMSTADKGIMMINHTIGSRYQIDGLPCERMF